MEKCKIIASERPIHFNRQPGPDHRSLPRQILDEENLFVKQKVCSQIQSGELNDLSTWVTDWSNLIIENVLFALK